MVNQMFDNFTDLLQFTDHELICCIALFVGGLFIMRVCQWVYVVCKWIYDWLSSMFSTSIDRS